jgi:hypothetical protein
MLEPKSYVACALLTQLVRLVRAEISGTQYELVFYAIRKQGHIFQVL